jgi:hypothetical protein
MQLSTSPTFDSIKATLSGTCFCVLTSLCFGQTEPILRFAATANPYVQATGPRMNFTQLLSDKSRHYRWGDQWRLIYRQSTAYRGSGV